LQAQEWWVAVIDEHHGVYDLPFLCVFVDCGSERLMSDGVTRN